MNILKNLRLEKGYKQKDVANLLGVGQRAYSNYELGKRQVPDDIKVKLASIFGVTVDYLLTGNDEFYFTDRSLSKIEILYNQLTPAQKDRVIAYITGLLEGNGIDVGRLISKAN